MTDNSPNSYKFHTIIQKFLTQVTTFMCNCPRQVPEHRRSQLSEFGFHEKYETHNKEHTCWNLPSYEEPRASLQDITGHVTWKIKA